MADKPVKIPFRNSGKCSYYIISTLMVKQNAKIVAVVIGLLVVIGLFFVLSNPIINTLHA